MYKGVDIPYRIPIQNYSRINGYVYKVQNIIEIFLVQHTLPGGIRCINYLHCTCAYRDYIYGKSSQFTLLFRPNRNCSFGIA